MLLLGDILTRRHQGRQSSTNWSIFNSSGFGIAVVCDEEHLTSVAKIPLPPESVVVAERVLEAHELAGLRRSRLRTRIEMFRREASEIRIDNLRVLESGTDLEAPHLGRGYESRALFIVPGAPAVRHNQCPSVSAESGHLVRLT